MTRRCSTRTRPRARRARDRPGGRRGLYARLERLRLHPAGRGARGAVPRAEKTPHPRRRAVRRHARPRFPAWARSSSPCRDTRACSARRGPACCYCKKNDANAAVIWRERCDERGADDAGLPARAAGGRARSTPPGSPGSPPGWTIWTRTAARPGHRAHERALLERLAAGLSGTAVPARAVSRRDAALQCGVLSRAAGAHGLRDPSPRRSRTGGRRAQRASTARRSPTGRPARSTPGRCASASRRSTRRGRSTARS